MEYSNISEITEISEFFKIYPIQNLMQIQLLAFVLITIGIVFFFPNSGNLTVHRTNVLSLWSKIFILNCIVIFILLLYLIFNPNTIDTTFITESFIFDPIIVAFAAVALILVTIRFFQDSKFQEYKHHFIVAYGILLVYISQFSILKIIESRLEESSGYYFLNFIAFVILACLIIFESDKFTEETKVAFEFEMIPVADRLQVLSKIATESTCLVKGMVNHGNTCFFNSSIQMLLSIPEFVEFFLKTNFDPQEQVVCSAFQQFIIDYVNTSEVNDPKNFISVLRTKINLLDNHQQDADEFIRLFLEILNNELKAGGPDMENFIKNFISCTFSDTIICKKCSGFAEVFDPSNVLYLSPQKSIQKGLDLKFGTRDIGGKEIEWKCSNCNEHTDISYSTSLPQSSKYLIVVLSRFPDANTKNNSIVAVNEKIKIENSEYEVISAACHRGTLKQGHYYAYCKRNKNWYSFNDSTSGPCNRYEGGSDSYIMVYSRIDKSAININLLD